MPQNQTITPSLARFMRKDHARNSAHAASSELAQRAPLQARGKFATPSKENARNPLDTVDPVQTPQQIYICTDGSPLCVQYGANVRSKCAKENSAANWTAPKPSEKLAAPKTAPALSELKVKAANLQQHFEASVGQNARLNVVVGKNVAKNEGSGNTPQLGRDEDLKEVAILRKQPSGSATMSEEPKIVSSISVVKPQPLRPNAIPRGSPEAENPVGSNPLSHESQTKPDQRNLVPQQSQPRHVNDDSKAREMWSLQQGWLSTLIVAGPRLETSLGIVNWLWFLTWMKLLSTRASKTTWTTEVFARWRLGRQRRKRATSLRL
jgi:hypothetical protein